MLSSTSSSGRKVRASRVRGRLGTSTTFHRSGPKGRCLTLRTWRLLRYPVEVLASCALQITPSTHCRSDALSVS